MSQNSQLPLRPPSLSIARATEQMISLLQSEKAEAIAEVNNQLSDLQRQYTELEQRSLRYCQGAGNSLTDALHRESNLHALLAEMSGELEVVKGIITALGMCYEMNEQTGQTVLTCYDSWRPHLPENLVNEVTLNWIPIPIHDQPSGTYESPPDSQSMSAEMRHADIACMPATSSQ